MDANSWYNWNYANVMEPFGMYPPQYPMQQQPQQNPQTPHFSAYGAPLNNPQNHQASLPHTPTNPPSTPTLHPIFSPQLSERVEANFTNVPTATNAIDSVVMRAAASGMSYSKGSFPSSQMSRGRKFLNKSMRSQFMEVQTPKYCDLCKCSCAGQQAYNAHLEGKAHKKKEATAQQQKTGSVQGGKKELYCELCQVYCSCSDALLAHVNGSKHQKIYKLQIKLGKSLPQSVVSHMSKNPAKIFKPASSPGNPPSTASGPSGGDDAVEDVVNSLINSAKNDAAVGQEYITEVMNSTGTTLQYHCKLCDCALSDAVAKAMHIKGKRHKVQYKKKVDPSYKLEDVDNNNSSKNWRGAYGGGYGGGALKRKNCYQDKYRQQAENLRYEKDFLQWQLSKATNSTGSGGGGGGVGCVEGGVSLYRNINYGRQHHQSGGKDEASTQSSSISHNNQHMVHKHTLIYPTAVELEAVQLVVGEVERALKAASDHLHAVALDKQEKSAAAAANINNVEPMDVTETTVVVKSETQVDVGGGDGSEAKAATVKSEPGTTTTTTTNNNNNNNNNINKSLSSNTTTATTTSTATTTTTSNNNNTNNGIDNVINKLKIESRASSAVPVRELKGVVRMGLVAKGLLIRGGVMVVELMILTSKPATKSLLRKIKEVMQEKMQDNDTCPIKLTVQLVSNDNYIKVSYDKEEEEEEEEEDDSSNNKSMDTKGNTNQSNNTEGQLENIAATNAHTAIPSANNPNATTTPQPLTTTTNSTTTTATNNNTENTINTTATLTTTNNSITTTTTNNTTTNSTNTNNNTKKERNKLLRAALRNVVGNVFIACADKVFPPKNQGCANKNNDKINNNGGDDDEEVDGGISDWAVTELIRTRWFQANMQSNEGKMLLLRVAMDLCARLPTWTPLPLLALELLVDRAYDFDSVSSPALALRRMFEMLSAGLFLRGGAGLVDRVSQPDKPCDAIGCLEEQQREDLTNSAQHALRLIALKQIHKVLGIPKLRNCY